MKIFSFFSYKGGAGRSTLAYNLIPILATNHFKPTATRPMVLIDTDVDSCGMSVLAKAKDKATDDNCVQHLLANGCSNAATATIAEHPFLKRLIPVGNAYGYAENEAILLLPAKHGKNIDPNGKSGYSDSGKSFSEAMNDFRKACAALGVCAIVIDSAVGDTALANISNEAADVIVCCMRPTLQFTSGTLTYFKSLENDEKMFDSKDIVLVPNVIPQKEITINGWKYPETAFSSISNDFNRFLNNLEDPIHEYHFDLLDESEFGIPALDRFMWREDSLFIQDPASLTAEEQTVLGRYKKLAALIYDI